MNAIGINMEKIREYNWKSRYFVLSLADLNVDESLKNECNVDSSRLKYLDFLPYSVSKIVFGNLGYLPINDPYEFVPNWVKIKKSVALKELEGDVMNLSYGDFDIFPETRLILNTSKADYEKHLIKSWESKMKEEELNNLLSTRTSAIQQLDSEVQELNTTHQELIIDYLFILPDDCHCEVKPTGHPDNNLLYENHIENCLDTSKKVNAFKDEIVSQIRIKAQLLNHKKKVIQEIINYSQNKGLTETELNSALGNEWKENLKYLLRESDVNHYKNEFLKLIGRKAESKTQDAETRQRMEEEIEIEGKKMAKEQAEQRQEIEKEEGGKRENREHKQNSEQENQPEKKEINKDNLLPDNSFLNNPKKELSENNNSSNQSNINIDKNTLIIKLKAEIAELKKNLDPNSTKQKALLAQKETQLSKLEGRQNIQDSKGNNPKKSNLTSILLPIGIIFAVLLVASSAVWIAKKRKGLKRMKKG